MKPCKMIVYIVDVSDFARICREKADEEIYLMLDKFYILVETIIAKAGGQVVKFMGDSAMIVFDIEKKDSAKLALQNLKDQSDDLWLEFDADCKLKVKSDICSLVCGEIGLEKRFDIVGNDLNELFMKEWD